MSARPMDNDEREIASALADYLTAGDDRIASSVGTISMLRNPYGVSTEIVVLIDDECDDSFEVTITARRRRR